jgi:hypothetical protein
VGPGDASTDANHFFAATAANARRVIDAEERWPTYHAGVGFQGLAISVAASPQAPPQYPNEEPMALIVIWGALMDEMERRDVGRLNRTPAPSAT